MRRSLLIVCLVVCMSVPAVFARTQSAEPASRDEVLQLFDVMNATQGIKEMQARMVPVLAAQFVRDMQRNNPALPPAEVSKLVEQFRSLVEKMPQDKLADVMVNAYQRHFSSPEIQQLTAFYQSAIGQKLLRETPQISTEYLQEAMPIMEEYLRAATDKLKVNTQQQH